MFMSSKRNLVRENEELKAQIAALAQGQASPRQAWALAWSRARVSSTMNGWNSRKPSSPMRNIASRKNGDIKWWEKEDDMRDRVCDCGGLGDYWIVKSGEFWKLVMRKRGR